MKITKIFLTTLLISNNFIYAINTPITNKQSRKQIRKNIITNDKNSFDDMLSLLKEKEKLEEKNNELSKKIKDLNTKLQISNKKFNDLSTKYNNVQKNKKNKNLKDNELITNEIEGRLPVPYIILNYNNEKIAKILKLNWYYVVKSDGTTMFNGRYLPNKLKIGDKYLTYVVKDINKNSINYCLIKDETKCLKKYLINNDIFKSMKKIVIVDGIPDELLTDKNSFQDILSKILSKTNPLTKRVSSEQSTNINQNVDINSLENILNPKVNNKSTGVTIPKNNIPPFEEEKKGNK